MRSEVVSKNGRFLAFPSACVSVHLRQHTSRTYGFGVGSVSIGVITSVREKVTFSPSSWAPVGA